MWDRSQVRNNLKRIFFFVISATSNQNLSLIVFFVSLAVVTYRIINHTIQRIVVVEGTIIESEMEYYNIFLVYEYNIIS